MMQFNLSTLGNELGGSYAVLGEHELGSYLDGILSLSGKLLLDEQLSGQHRVLLG